MGNWNTAHAEPMDEDSSNPLLPMEVDPPEDLSKEAKEWKEPQGHVRLLFGLLRPHVPDAIVNVIFLFELSLPRDENAHVIQIEGDAEGDISSLEDSQLSSLQFGDMVVKTSRTTSPSA